MKLPQCCLKSGIKGTQLNNHNYLHGHRFSPDAVVRMYGLEGAHIMRGNTPNILLSELKYEEIPMNQHIYRSYREEKREMTSWDERWDGQDKGLITCWEVGRELSKRKPEVAERAKNGELPELGWKGGVEKKLKKKEKYGTLFYLAQWQGLRGEDLDIDLSEETILVCSKTGMKVIYTGDIKKYGNA